jgi:short-subunit dehydrogenase
MISIQGRWSLVTGASRGVGSHVSEGLARLGSNVVLHSRELSHTRALAARLEALETHPIEGAFS